MPLGRVIDVKVRRNGHMRSCVIKTPTSQMIRPITRFCLLESINLRNMNHGGVITVITLTLWTYIEPFLLQPL